MASPTIPNRPNPKPRNSEAVDPLRRSFGGNPFPVNSRVNTPSDVSRRNSFGGRDFSNKENETKPLPKGSKNFMSPTISAVSKINPSPRKRVLSDRNQVSRSLSDVKGLTFEEDTKGHQSCVSFSDVLHIIGTDEKKKKRFERPHDMTVTDFDESEALVDDKGIVYSDPRFRISPRPSVPYTSPEFADREVAPSLLPPYDPKTNYLSPRPQFLHYKPNPRVEKHFDECKQLEELFISESSSSDTELSAEEQENDVSHEGGDEEVAGEETEDVERVEAESDEKLVCESIEETSQVPKQSGFRPFRFIGWFLALSLGCLLVSASFSGLSILEESTLYEFRIPEGVKEFAEANKLEELSGKIWTLTESSLVYMVKLMSRLGGGTEEYVPLQLHNLTYSLEESSVFQPTRVEINGEPLHGKVRVENILEDDYENEFEEESGGEENSEIEDDEVIKQTEMTPGIDVELKEGEENLEAFAIEKPEVILPEVNNDAEGLQSQESLETGSTKKDQEEIEVDTEAIYIDQHDVETAAIKAHQQIDSVFADAESGPEEGFRDVTGETSDDLHPELQLIEVDGAESESEVTVKEIAAETSEDVHPEARSFNKAMIVLSSTVLVILAAVAFLFTKHVAVSASEPAPEEPVENLVKEKLSSLNIQAEEVDDRLSNSVHKKELIPQQQQSS